MARIEGGILLTNSQIKRLAKGKTLVIWRDGKQLTIGSKGKAYKITRLKTRMTLLKAEIEKLEKNGHEVKHKAATNEHV